MQSEKSNVPKLLSCIYGQTKISVPQLEALLHACHLQFQDFKMYLFNCDYMHIFVQIFMCFHAHAFCLGPPTDRPSGGGDSADNSGF